MSPEFYILGKIKVYFNLDTKPKTPFRQELERLFTYTSNTNFRQKFIENFFRKNDTNKISRIFF